MQLSKEIEAARGGVVTECGLYEDDLVQASRELLRYLEEFPGQDVIEESELVDWYYNVVCVVGCYDMRARFLGVCADYYPGVILEINGGARG